MKMKLFPKKFNAGHWRTHQAFWFWFWFWFVNQQDSLTNMFADVRICDMRMLSDLQLVYMGSRNSTQFLNINTTKFQAEREPVDLVGYSIRSANRGGGVATPPLNFGEGGLTPSDFEKTCCLIAHIGPFLIA